MDLMKMGTDMLMAKLGGGADAGGVQSVLSGLIGDGDQMDIAGMIGKLQVNQASSGGSLLDSVGGLGGLAGMAKKFL